MRALAGKTRWMNQADAMALIEGDAVKNIVK